MAEGTKHITVFDMGKIEKVEAHPQVMKAQAALHVLSEVIEECGMGMAGDVDRTQVARVISLSHEMAQLAERLRPAG